MLYYITFVKDLPALIYHGDCQWVLHGSEKGKYHTTHGTAVHADIWKRFWRIHDKRRHPILVYKVKAHVTEIEVTNGYPKIHRDGNCFVDRRTMEDVCTRRMLSPSTLRASRGFSFLLSESFLPGLITRRWRPRMTCRLPPMMTPLLVMKGLPAYLGILRSLSPTRSDVCGAFALPLQVLPYTAIAF